MKTKLLILFLTFTLLCSSSCALQDVLVDYIMNIAYGDAEGEGLAPLAERIPARVGKLALSETSCEETYGYAIYRFSEVSAHAAERYLTELRKTEGLMQVSAPELPAEGEEESERSDFLRMYSCRYSDESLWICYYGQTLLLLVGNSAYLPPAGNCPVLCGMPVDRLGELPYDDTEGEYWNPSYAQMIKVGGKQVWRQKDVSYEAVMNYIWTRRTEGYIDADFTAERALPDNPSIRGTRICIMLRREDRYCAVLYDIGRAVMTEKLGGVDLTEEQLWGAMEGAVSVMPGLGFFAQNTPPLERTRVMPDEEGRAFRAVWAESVMREVYDAYLLRIAEQGYAMIETPDAKPEDSDASDRDSVIATCYVRSVEYVGREVTIYLRLYYQEKSGYLEIQTDLMRKGEMIGKPVTQVGQS